MCWCNNLKELNHRECYLINLYKTLAPNGYNLCEGGYRGKKSKITREKMSKARLGKKHTEEIKRNEY